MKKQKSYAGIDYFRIIAALLIIAIHTSPLASYTETGDFILTRIVARIAVPFFFMVSGFFLISRYDCQPQKLISFLKKTALIYGTAILLYIPVNIYNDYFKMDYLLPNIIKDILFDGTFYHLWYLPASMLGAGIAWYLLKHLDYAKSIVILSILYIIGLFGDSYYGLIENIPFLKGCFDLLFQISDYTRNGFFFAPVFFLLGGLIADSRYKLPLGKSVCGFGISFALMFAEAMFLHDSGLQRHDSMYVFLLPCMYFLFQAILHFKGKRHAGLRTSSLVIYIIHPMMIVVIRMFAKLIHLQNILVENSLVHYLAVCLSSVIFSVAATLLWEKLKPKKHRPDNTDRAYLEINLDNLAHNVKVLKKAMPEKCELMAVVKAEAYGHRMCEIASYLNRIGVNAFAVATIDEGIKLRQCGIKGEILILGYTNPERAKELRKYDLTQTLIDYHYALLLNNQGYHIKAHIKVDTGMHRLGFDVGHAKQIMAVFVMKYINVCGIYTHLCASDSRREEDISFTKMQIERFYKMLHLLEMKGIALPKIHIQSSYGLINYPELECDYARIGILLYGVLSSPCPTVSGWVSDLKPVLSLRAKVILLRAIKKGESVSYSRSFIAKRDSMIAVLPVGYADGFPRNLSDGKSYVLINGQAAPIVGKICMDQLTVDVTDIPGVKPGMTATLIGSEMQQEISAPVVAANSESISNELLSRMGARLNTKVL